MIQKCYLPATSDWQVKTQIMYNKNSCSSDLLLLCMCHITCSETDITKLFTQRVTAVCNTRILTTSLLLGYVLEVPDISKANSIANTSQQDGQFAVTTSSFFFTNNLLPPPNFQIPKKEKDV